MAAAELIQVPLREIMQVSQDQVTNPAYLRLSNDDKKDLVDKLENLFLEIGGVNQGTGARWNHLRWVESWVDPFTNTNVGGTIVIWNEDELCDQVMIEHPSVKVWREGLRNWTRERKFEHHAARVIREVPLKHALTMLQCGASSNRDLRRKKELYSNESSRPEVPVANFRAQTGGLVGSKSWNSTY
jgi:hypothetical protein